MGPATAINIGFAKSFQFSGRASRSEYWWFFLATFVLALPMMGIDLYLLNKDIEEATISFWPASDTFAILSTIPLTAVGAKRLQDISLPGWPAILAGATFIIWITTDWGKSWDEPFSYIGILCSVLSIALIIAAIFPSKFGTNKYGPNPHEVPS